MWTYLLQDPDSSPALWLSHLAAHPYHPGRLWKNGSPSFTVSICLYSPTATDLPLKTHISSALAKLWTWRTQAIITRPHTLEINSPVLSPQTIFHPPQLSSMHALPAPQRPGPFGWAHSTSSRWQNSISLQTCFSCLHSLPIAQSTLLPITQEWNLEMKLLLFHKGQPVLLVLSLKLPPAPPAPSLGSGSHTRLLQEPSNSSAYLQGGWVRCGLSHASSLKHQSGFPLPCEGTAHLGMPCPVTLYLPHFQTPAPLRQDIPSPLSAPELCPLRHPSSCCFLLPAQRPSLLWRTPERLYTWAPDYTEVHIFLRKRLTVFYRFSKGSVIQRLLQPMKRPFPQSSKSDPVRVSLSNSAFLSFIHSPIYTCEFLNHNNHTLCCFTKLCISLARKYISFNINTVVSCIDWFGCKHELYKLFAVWS